MKKEKIEKVQALLQKESLDGWLIYDFQKRNFLGIEFLEIPSSHFLSRRVFYWIPAKGDPVKIVHEIDSHVLDTVPGILREYLTWKSLEENLKEVLSGVSCIAMEYSPRSMIPAVSFVDGGILDLIREYGVKIATSANFIQEFTCSLSPIQRQTHLLAAKALDESVEAAWQYISDCLKTEKRVTEYDVQQLIASRLEEEGFFFEAGPICAVNENSSNPHYVPEKHKHKEIRVGDFVLIDLWCKKKEEGAIYADICRVGVADNKATQRQVEIFSIVRRAQEEATNLVRQRVRENKPLSGWEVDLAARKVIEQAGYGKYFIHRTGHNIYIQDHGPGTHMDSFETFDDRLVLPRTCFSIEPGIYLPNEFGVRLEYDVYITEEAEVEVTGGVQRDLRILL